MAPEPRYDEMAEELTGILHSYVPKSGLVAQLRVAPQSAVTLYTAPRFAGLTRVVTGDTANTMLLGWKGRTGSLVIAGYGEWQVCEGVNFSGRCGVLAGAYSSTPNTSFHVGSLRRLSSPKSLRGLLSVVSTMGGMGAINAGAVQWR
jgi:hypothetical protein